MRKSPTIVNAIVCSVMLLSGSAFAADVQDPAAPPTVAEAQTLQQNQQYEEAAAAWQAILQSQPDNAAAWFNLGYSLHMAGELEPALKAHRKAATYEQFEGIARYNEACALALMGDKAGALEALEASKQAGFDRIGLADEDPDLDSIRDDPRYEVIMGRAPEAPVQELMQADAQDEAQPAQEAPTQRMTISQEAIAAGRERLPRLFQTVAERMQPIIEELSPEIEQRAGEIAEVAMRHVQELLGRFQHMVSEDEELMSAIEEIHHTLSNDPEFMALVQQAQQWIEQQMGGGAPPAADAAAAPPQATLPADSIETAAQPAATLEEALRMQQAGNHEAATRMFATLREQDPESAAAAFGYAYNLHMTGAHEEAIEAHQAAAEFDDVRGISLYNLACANALTGRLDAAMEALNASVEAGFDVGSFMADDADLDSLREDPRFIELQRRLTGG